MILRTAPSVVSEVTWFRDLGARGLPWDHLWLPGSASTFRASSMNIVSCNNYRHDFDALRAASTRVVIGVGAESGQTGEPDAFAATLRTVLAG